MRPNLTIDPVVIARDLAGLTGCARAEQIDLWIMAFTAAIVACGDDTEKVINGTDSVLWLRNLRAAPYRFIR